MRNYEPGTVSNSLIQNNLFDGGPGAYIRNFMNDGGSSNVFAYNYVTRNSQGLDSFQFSGITNHKPHGSFNLYEGNVVNSIEADGYHGSVSHDTLFRNNFTGAAPWLTGGADAGNRIPVNLARWTTYYNIIGNVLGSPSWTPVQYSMTGAPDYYSNPVIYRLGYPNAANNDLSDAVGCTAPANFDPNVQATLLRQKNYDYFYNTQRVCGSESEGCQGATNVAASDTIADSLYLPSKPSWFGSLTFPPINPSSPSVSDIPAKVFYETGVWPDDGAVPPPDTTPPSTPANLTATAVSSSQINLSWTTSTDNIGVTGYQIYRGGTLLTTVTGTSYSNTGLSPSTSYSYYVRATDAVSSRCWLELRVA